MKTFLFAGGQHHGKMLPICEQSIREAAEVYAISRSRPYAGYRLVAIRLREAGTRFCAVREPAKLSTDRLSMLLLDAMAIALDACEHALGRAIKLKRPIPRNASLPDDPGRPGERNESAVAAYFPLSE
jgi:hypothetical protein